MEQVDVHIFTAGWITEQCVVQLGIQDEHCKHLCAIVEGRQTLKAVQQLECAEMCIFITSK